MIQQVYIGENEILLAQNIGGSVRHLECLAVDSSPILDDLCLIPWISFDRLAHLENMSGKDMAGFGITVTDLVNQLSKEDESSLFQKVVSRHRKIARLGWQNRQGEKRDDSDHKETLTYQHGVLIAKCVTAGNCEICIAWSKEASRPLAFPEGSAKKS